MKVRYISSACVVVEHQGVRVLCDPWLTDGIYYGSWFHYPPLKFQPEDFSDVDWIYLSHIHPDHFDPGTLSRLPRSIPVLILEYADKFLLRQVQKLGFQEIREIPNGERLSIGEDFALELYAADNCNSEICGRFFDCSLPSAYSRTIQLDSLALFEGGGKRVVNANDCPYGLAWTVCDRLLKRHPGVDFLLLGYSGAGEYPQCFEGQLAAPLLLEKARAKRTQFLDQAARYLAHLRPVHFMPFAGQYVLAGPLARLNPLRGVPEIEELPAEFERRLREGNLSGQMVLLNAGDGFDVETGKASAPFIPPDPAERDRYIQGILSSRTYPYHEEFRVDPKDRTDLTPRLAQARERMWKYQQAHGYRSDWRVYLDTGQQDLYRVPFNGEPVTRTPRGSEAQPFVRIQLDYSLLCMILERKAHWNNAAIGSHLSFFRDPEQFERGVYHWLSYLHC